MEIDFYTNKIFCIKYISNFFINYMNKEIDIIQSAIKIQTFLKHTLYQFNKCIKKKKTIFNKINNLVSKTEYNYNNDIIDQEKYTSNMEYLELLLVDFYKIPVIKKNSFNFKLSYIKLLANLSLLNTKLITAEKKFGNTSIINIISSNLNWKTYLSKYYITMIEYIDNLFIPLEYKFNKNKNYVHKKKKIFRIIPKEIEDNKPITIKNTNLITDNMKHKLNSASIQITFGDNYLDIIGLFKNDPLNLQKKNGFFKEKYKQLMNDTKELDVPQLFAVGYINQLNLKDFIVLQQKKIIFKLLNAWQDHNRYGEKNVSSLVKEFLMCKLNEQINILTTLLLSDDPKINHLAYLLYDMISSSSDTIKPQFMAEDIYKNLHWTVQKRFKQAYKKVSELRHNLRKINNIQIPYEDKILHLNAPEYVISKAMEKLKEVSTSKESHKARAYLDGLLKIPFSEFKQEHIIVFLTKFYADLKNSNYLIKSKISKINHTSSLATQIYDAISPTIEYFENNKISNESKINEFINKLKKSISKINKFISDYNKSISDQINDTSMQNNTNLLYPSSISNSHTKINIQKDFLKLSSLAEEIQEILDTIFYQWNQYQNNKKLYINQVRTILDNSMYGQNDAKKEIERIIAQWINGKQEGTVIGLCGPPGTGKTTLSKKGIAHCLKDESGKSRPFAFIALGGSTNSSTLVGHSYTYQGSVWGRIIDILMETKCMNPIIYFDELDKVSRSEHGREIIGILTHLTDPSQNKEFSDKYFAGIKFDLSKVLIVFSYNDSSLIDRILRDRITEIKISPYSKNEKLKISQNFIIPQLLEITGYSHDDIIIDQNEIKYIIDTYTIEAGVRKLREKLFELIREINLNRMFDDTIKLPYTITIDFIKKLFSNKPKVHFKKIALKPYIGLVNGLYATAAGTGGITLIEVMKTPPNDTKLALELTGQQGDVMKESMKCARTVAWNIIPDSIKKKIKLEWEEIGSYGLHIHCPEASTPKDGPSAGITITIGIISRLTGIPVKNIIAMTGEIDLNGKVHKIGGLEYKLDGAKKAGVKLVLIPLDNQQDFDILLDKLSTEDKNILLDDFQVKTVSTIYDVIKLSLIDNDIQFNTI
jgi:endopeptidase La